MVSFCTKWSIEIHLNESGADLSLTVPHCIFHCFALWIGHFLFIYLFFVLFAHVLLLQNPGNRFMDLAFKLLWTAPLMLFLLCTLQGNWCSVLCPYNFHIGGAMGCLLSSVACSLTWFVLTKIEFVQNAMKGKKYLKNNEYWIKGLFYFNKFNLLRAS